MGDDKADQYQKAIAAALRAIAAKGDLEISFDGGSIKPGTLGKIADSANISLPKLKSMLAGEIEAARAAADRISLRKRFSDAKIHARQTPPDPTARPAFEMMEQARCEAVGG